MTLVYVAYREWYVSCGLRARTPDVAKWPGLAVPHTGIATDPWSNSRWPMRPLARGNSIASTFRRWMIAALFHRVYEILASFWNSTKKRRRRTALQKGAASTRKSRTREHNDGSATVRLVVRVEFASFTQFLVARSFEPIPVKLC